MSEASRPSIFFYSDYRAYLIDIFNFFKETKSFFSFRYFAKKAGLSSPSLLKMVMEGARRPSPPIVEKFIKGFGLKGAEADYFRLLVQYSRARNDAERNKLVASLRKVAERKKAYPLSLDQHVYFSNWFIPVLREMIPLQNFVPDPYAISHQLFGEIDPLQVRQSLSLLKRLKMVESKKGKLIQKIPHITTDETMGPLALKNFHREMMDQAKKSIERSRPEERELQALTLAIDPALMPEAKERIRRFVAEMRDFLSQGSNDQVCQLNVQFFNLTRNLK